MKSLLSCFQLQIQSTELPAYFATILYISPLFPARSAEALSLQEYCFCSVAAAGPCRRHRHHSEGRRRSRGACSANNSNNTTRRNRRGNTAITVHQRVLYHNSRRPKQEQLYVCLCVCVCVCAARRLSRSVSSLTAASRGGRRVAQPLRTSRAVAVSLPRLPVRTELRRHTDAPVQQRALRADAARLALQLRGGAQLRRRLRYRAARLAGAAAGDVPSARRAVAVY